MYNGKKEEDMKIKNKSCKDMIKAFPSNEVEKLLSWNFIRKIVLTGKKKDAYFFLENRCILKQRHLIKILILLGCYLSIFE